MPFDIIWSPEARTSYLSILKYLDEEWSASERQHFENLVSQVLQLIGEFPMLYEYSPKSDTHRCVLTKQVSLFYQTRKQTQEVELLVFWDTRQDPEKLSF